MSCIYVCPGGATVYINIAAGDQDDASPNNLAGTWEKIPEVLSWEIEADTDDPTTFRTADTNNVKIAACPGATEFSATVTTKLCLDPAKFLYTLLFDSATQVDGWNVGANTYGATPLTTTGAWFYFTWSNADPPGATPAPTDPGVYAHGKITPPGFGLDNDSDDAAEAEFGITIDKGPFWPVL